MIVTRKRRGLRTATYTLTRPRSLRTTLRTAINRSKADSFTAASDFENALMDQEWSKADQIRHRELCMWLKMCGADHAKRIPRPRAAA